MGISHFWFMAWSERAQRHQPSCSMGNSVQPQGNMPFWCEQGIPVTGPEQLGIPILRNALTYPDTAPGDLLQLPQT